MAGLYLIRPWRTVSGAAPFALMALTRMGAKKTHGGLMEEVCHAGALRQGLTLVHFSPQPDPLLPLKLHKSIQHTLRRVNNDKLKNGRVQAPALRTAVDAVLSCSTDESAAPPGRWHAAGAFTRPLFSPT